MTDVRAELRMALHALSCARGADLRHKLASIAHPESRWRIAHPVGELIGAEAAADAWFSALCSAFPGHVRRDDLVIGGTSSTGSGTWVAVLGHLAGTFAEPLAGIAPSGKLAFLRLGEFYRIEDGKIAEAIILPDILDLLRQAGRLPPIGDLGTEMMFPPPATHDGILPNRPDLSASSLHVVEAMLRDLKAYNPDTFESDGQFGPGGYWREDMFWYGPAGIGSNFGYDGFQRDHRIPFLTAFPDRIGGNHFARFGDGVYVASGGWPSMTMTHAGPYLGVEATGRPLTLRVMDFWRVADDGRIAENWVLLDLLELALQMGRDILAESATMARR